MAGYIFRTYSCDGGDDAEPHEFKLMIERDQHPRFCPVCGASFDGDPEIVPGGGHIGGSAIARSVDGMYREVERSSAERAELAGNPALRVTDMNDHLREGDVAAKMPVNTVTQFMDVAGQSGARYGFGGGAMTGVSFNQPATPVPSNTWTGPGHRALSGIQGEGGGTNAQMRHDMTSAGRIKDTVSGER